MSGPGAVASRLDRAALAITSWASTNRGMVRIVINALAVAGAFVCAGQVALWSWMGAWPFHDTAAYWVAGLHLREGVAVYQPGAIYLAFLYAPPFAILAVPLSFIPLQPFAASLLVLQVLALRYIAGSWRAAGLMAWLPFVPRELVTGNIDLLVAATLYASVRQIPRSGYAVALFGMMKFSPALTLIIGSRTRWREAIVGGVVLVAITLPLLHLWPEWVSILGSISAEQVLPLQVRLPIGLILLAYRRSWSVAAGAALLTPALYFHSLVQLLPAARLLLDARLARADRPRSHDNLLRRQPNRDSVISSMK
jgi:hypothetical protein